MCLTRSSYIVQNRHCCLWTTECRATTLNNLEIPTYVRSMNFSPRLGSCDMKNKCLVSLETLSFCNEISFLTNKSSKKRSFTRNNFLLQRINLQRISKPSKTKRVLLETVSSTPPTVYETIAWDVPNGTACISRSYSRIPDIRASVFYFSISVSRRKEKHERRSKAKERTFC